MVIKIHVHFGTPEPLSTLFYIVLIKTAIQRERERELAPK
jgi:hypothetical protein